MGSTLKFYLMTDLHHYAHSLGTEGKAFKKMADKDQKCLAETGAIINAYIDKILQDTEIETVLIAGDVSCNGAMESHLDLLPRLKRLRDGGKRVCLITATHDYNPKPERCDGDRVGTATPTEREELFDLYFDYGLSEALSVHRESHSYCVRLREGYRLLCLNDDGDRIFCGYSDSQLGWIEEQLDAARSAGDYIFAMTHHPVLPPSPIYPLFSKRDMLGNWEKTADFLADRGVKFVFTGHTHMQNIARRISAAGNELYDINTCSLVGYPTAMRRVVMDGEYAEIGSVSIDGFDWDMGGKTVEEYVKDNFLYLLNDIVNSAAEDIDHLANDLAPGFSRTPEQIYKMKIPLKAAGKILQRLTVGTLAKMLFIGGSADKSIRNVKVKDFLLSVMCNMFHGDEPYAPGTAEYKFFSALIGRAKSVVGLKKGSESVLRLLDTALCSIYDEPPADWQGKFKM